MARTLHSTTGRAGPRPTVDVLGPGGAFAWLIEADGTCWRAEPAEGGTRPAASVPAADALAALPPPVAVAIRSVLEHGAGKDLGVDEAEVGFEHEGKSRRCRIRAFGLGSGRSALLVQDQSADAAAEAQILRAGEHERRWIRQELHDGVGQQLTALAFLAKVLEQGLAADGSRRETQAAELGVLIQHAVRQVRDLCRWAGPSSPSGRPSGEALRDLAAELGEQYGIRCSAAAQCGVSWPVPAATQHLVPIVQEAVRNAVLHGKAQAVEIRLEAVDGSTALVIRDDGCGVAADAASRGAGMGLVLMEIHARRLGGSLEVRRDPRGGTRVAVRLAPLRN